MRLHDYWEIVRARWITIVLMTALGGALAAAVSIPATPQYQATASVYFSLPNGDTNADLSQGSTYTQAQMQSYAELATQPIVLSRVIDELGLDGATTKQVAQSVTATADTQSVILSITARDPSPGRSSVLANSVADQLQQVVRDLAPKNAKDQPSVNALTVGQAQTPTAPVSPRSKRNLVVGLLAGFMIGVAAAIARATLDTRVRDEEEVTRISGSPVLTLLSYDRRARRTIAMTDEPQSRSAEAFRKMRTNMRYVRATHAIDVVTITSALPGEGKTTTAINFALACAEAGDRVLLIDADLRKPTVARRLGMVAGGGLTSVLAGGGRVADLVQPWGLVYPIDVLTSGDVPPNPTQLVDSDTMGDLIHAVTKEYDVVVIDSPPLLPVTDAALLAARSSGAIIVSNVKKVHRSELKKAVGALEQVHAPIIGVVVKGAPHVTSSQVYGYVNPEPSAWASVGTWLRRRSPRPDGDGIGKVAGIGPSKQRVAPTEPRGSTNAAPRGSADRASTRPRDGGSSPEAVGVSVSSAGPRPRKPGASRGAPQARG